jgi:hypothetical protein
MARLTGVEPPLPHGREAEKDGGAGKKEQGIYPPNEGGAVRD